MPEKGIVKDKSLRDLIYFQWISLTGIVSVVITPFMETVHWRWK